MNHLERPKAIGPICPISILCTCIVQAQNPTSITANFTSICADLGDLAHPNPSHVVRGADRPDRATRPFPDFLTAHAHYISPLIS